MSQLVVRHRGDGLILAEIGSVCVAVWEKKPTPDTFEIQRIVLTEVARARPKKVAFLCVIDERSEPPDTEVRRRSAEMASNLKDVLAGICCVVEGEGFRAAIARTALSGIRLLARSVGPLQVTSSVEEAASRALPRILLGENLAHLAEEVRALRNASEMP